MTTARKFRSSEHRLYIVKNPNDHRNSSIVGILKVGCKHLYIYDSQGRVHERTPLCILDFYVHESKQRLGFGKRLFDTMLEVRRDENRHKNFLNFLIEPMFSCSSLKKFFHIN